MVREGTNAELGGQWQETKVRKKGKENFSTRARKDGVKMFFTGRQKTFKN